MKNLLKARNISYYLFAVLLLAFLLRFYNLHSWLFFGMDQEYEALIINNILSGKHFPLIGVNAGDTGLYLGPFFIYFAAIPYALFSGDPLGGAITASLLGIMTCYLVYWVGERLYSQRIGLLASLFYAGSFLVSFYERKFWNPTLIPLFSLLIGYFLYQLTQRKSKFLYLLALTFGLAVQSHLSIVILLPLIIYIIWTNRQIFSRKIIILSLGIFLLLQSPIILFEIRHDFLNSKAFFNLISGRQQGIISRSTFYERNGLLLSTLGRFFSVPPAPDLYLESGQCRTLSAFRKNAYPEGMILILTGVSIFTWWYYKNKSRKNIRWPSRIIIIIFILTLSFVQFYQRIIFEYYFLFLFPWLAIALGWSADFLWQKKYGKLLIIPIIIFFIVSNLLSMATANFSYGYKDKLAAISFIKKQLKGEDYTLEALGECPRYGGYRYLFDYFYTRPISSYMDSNLGWLYQADAIRKKEDSYIVLLSLIDPRDKAEVIAKWEEIKLQYLINYKAETKRRFGQIQVFILSPKNTI